MTLKELYDKILSSPEKWKYYSGMDFTTTKCNVEQLFSSDNCARDFIECYFKAGDKLSVLYDEHSDKMEGRWIHTLSVFLLGIALADLLGIDFSQEFQGNKKYLYHWYLTCLYHDYGYTIENKSKEYLHYGYKLRSLFYSINGKSAKYYLRMKNEDSEFSTQIRNKYHKFCIQRGFVNHGIIGGLLLYSQLRNHLQDKINEHGGKRDFYEGELYYSIKQKKDFAICADAIIAHNIWFNVSPISDLNLTADNKHTYKHWLTALLVLCDTIEPIKVFNCCNPTTVLENLELEIDVKNNTLVISGNNSCCNYNNYIEKCNSLQDWTYIVPMDVNAISIKLTCLKKLYN